MCRSPWRAERSSGQYGHVRFTLQQGRRRRRVESERRHGALYLCGSDAASPDAASNSAVQSYPTTAIRMALSAIRCSGRFYFHRQITDSLGNIGIRAMTLHVLPFTLFLQHISECVRGGPYTAPRGMNGGTVLVWTVRRSALARRARPNGNGSESPTIGHASVTTKRRIMHRVSRRSVDIPYASGAGATR